MNLNADDALKAVFGAVLAAILAIVTWLVKTVIGNREAAIVGRERTAVIEDRLSRCQGDKTTKEDVREVIEDALTKRDVRAAERRAEWDTRLTLEIKNAVSDGIKDCKDTFQHPRPSGSGEVGGL